jgi:hypothetical protein
MLRRRVPPEKIALDNLVIIAVFLIALAQALTILLTIRRERDIKNLAELVDEQRLHLAEVRAWLAGRNAARPPLTKSEREPAGEPVADNTKAAEQGTTPKDSPQSKPLRTSEDEAAQAKRALSWQREIFAGLRAGLKGGAVPPEEAATTAPEPAVTTGAVPEAKRPGSTEDELKRESKAFKWFKEDTNEPREIVEAREMLANLKKGGPVSSEPTITLRDFPDPTGAGTTEEELDRATKAINWLKDDADKAREIITNLHGTPPAKKTG